MQTFRIFRLIAAAAFVASCAPGPEAAGPVVIPQIAGRVAGPPQRCVPIESSASMMLEGHSLLYSTGSVVWVNTTTCQASANDLPVFHPFGSQHCRGDIVQTVDRYTHMQGPSCVLGDFVPYRRP